MKECGDDATLGAGPCAETQMTVVASGPVTGQAADFL